MRTSRERRMLPAVFQPTDSELGLPPVLLVHGTFSHGGLMEPWKRYLENAGFECHAPSMPGRLPTDRAVLRSASFGDYLDRLLEYRSGMDRTPIVMGHSMGGLLAQKLAERTDTTGLVLLASVPPGVLWPQPRAAPHLAKMLPRILAGRPILPSHGTLRAIVFHDLPEHEQRTLPPQLVTDSGRAFRSLILGLVRVKRDAVRCPVLCVSGGVDRNVAPMISRGIAKRYGAEHHVHQDRGHWIVAESKVQEVAPPVLAWLERVGAVPAGTAAPA